MAFVTCKPDPEFFDVVNKIRIAGDHIFGTLGIYTLDDCRKKKGVGIPKYPELEVTVTDDGRPAILCKTLNLTVPVKLPPAPKQTTNQDSD